MADVVYSHFLGGFGYGEAGGEAGAGGFQLQVGQEAGGGGMGVFLEEPGVVAFGQSDGAGEEGDGKFFVQMEVHAADALFHIPDAEGVLVGGCRKQPVPGKKGGKYGEEEGGKPKGHGFIGGWFHGGHLLYGGQERPVGGIIGGNEGGKGEFSFCQLASCGKKCGVMKELKAVGAQEHVADLAGPKDPGRMEFIRVYEQDVAFLKGEASAVYFQASGD